MFLVTFQWGSGFAEMSGQPCSEKGNVQTRTVHKVAKVSY